MNFDDKAKDWDKNPLFIERADLLAKEIKSFLHPPKTACALDLGCGTGLLSYFLKDDFETIILADSSKGMLEVLSQRIELESITNFIPLHLDLSKSGLPSSTKKVDVVFSSMAFHHIEEIDKLMQSLQVITNPAAYVCIADLDAEDGRFHFHDPLFDGHKGFSKSEIESFLTRNGFDIKSYKIVFEIEREFPDGTSQKYPVFLVIGQKV